MKTMKRVNGVLLFGRCLGNSNPTFGSTVFCSRVICNQLNSPLHPSFLYTQRSRVIGDWSPHSDTGLLRLDNFNPLVRHGNPWGTGCPSNPRYHSIKLGYAENLVENRCIGRCGVGL